MPPPTNRCIGSIIFSGCPSVSACFRACVRVSVLLARYLTNQVTKFHQTLINDVFEVQVELIRFKVKESIQDEKVIYLSELLLGAEVYIWTLGRRSII